MEELFKDVFFFDHTVTISALTMDTILFNADCLQLYLMASYCTKAHNGEGLEKLWDRWVKESGEEERKNRYAKAVKRLKAHQLIRVKKDGFDVKLGEQYERTSYRFIEEDGKDVMIVCEHDMNDEVFLTERRKVTPVEMEMYRQMSKRVIKEADERQDKWFKGVFAKERVMAHDRSGDS